MAYVGTPKYRKRKKYNYKKKKYLKKEYKKGLLPMPRNKLNVEQKWFDVAENAYNCTTTGVLQLINNMSQGSSENQRIGARASIRSLYVKGAIVSTATTATVKVVIVYDKKANGSLVKLGDNSSLNTIYNCIANACTPRVQLFMPNNDRFVIVGSVELPMNLQVAASAITMPFRFYKKFDKGLQIHFNGTGSSYDYISDGSLYLGFMSDQTAGVTGYVSSRIRFTDD